MTELWYKSSQAGDDGTAELSRRSEPTEAWQRASLASWSDQHQAMKLLAFATNNAIVWNKPGVSEFEIKRMKATGSPAEFDDVVKMKSQIAANGQDPESVLLAAAQNNRVVGFSDVHGPLGPHQALLIKEMPKLKQAGITHLGVELPQQFQSTLDSWTPADKEVIRSRHKDKSSLVEIIDAAKKEGITVVALDEMYNSDVDAQRLPTRDVTMAGAVENILKDDNAKALLFLGPQHLQSGSGSGFGPSVSALLKEKFTTSTFYQQLASKNDPLAPLAADLAVPLSVAPKDAPSIKHLRLTDAATTQISMMMAPTYGRFDSVILYPKDYGMEQAQDEAKALGKDPKTELVKAVLSHDVLEIGEMNHLLPEDENPPERPYIASVISDLSTAGVKELAVDLDPKNQADLDEFSRTGKLNIPPTAEYGKNFEVVLSAAVNAGMHLTAIGTADIRATGRQYLEALATDIAKLRQDTGSKVMFYATASSTANFVDQQGVPISLRSELASRGVSAAAFASVSQDYTAYSLGRLTSLLTKPIALDSSKSTLLKELPTTDSALARYDNVIIFPDSDRDAPAKPPGP